MNKIEHVKYSLDKNETVERLVLIFGLDYIKIAFFFDTTVAEILEWENKFKEFEKSIISGLKKYVVRFNINQIKNRKRKLKRKQVSYLKTANKYQKKRYNSDFKIRINNNISSSLRSRIKNKPTGTLRHLDFTIEELIIHLEALFLNGMTWNNYGKVWHIDHIKPVKLFKFESVNDIEFKKCWSLKNLQPLFALDNLQKGSKY